MQFSALTPLAYFAALVADDESVSLVEAAASLVHMAEPTLDTQAVLSQMDALAEQLKRRIPADAAPLARLNWLNRFFYQELGFAGNVNDYYDPGNSFLSTVLRTRRGIPISLAVLYLALADEIGLVARGVSFPGHFLIKLRLPQGEAIIDPMRGHSLSLDQLQELLQPYLAQQGLVGELAVPLGLFLQAASSREVLARMLRNLKEIYRSHDDGVMLLAVLDRLVILLPDAWSERRDRGLAHAALGHDALALEDLSAYLVHEAHADDAQAVGERIAALRGAAPGH